VSWSLKFDQPIDLTKGKALLTLRDAANHIIALPPRETKQLHWQTAIACLLSAAEKRGELMMARIAMMQALSNGKASPSERLRSAKALRPSKSRLSEIELTTKPKG
jgi:hypothetical protein